MKKLILALVVGGMVFSAAYAAAASLGLDTNDLGAGDDIVSSCVGPGALTPGANVELTYDTLFTAASKDYRVTNMNVVGITSACTDQTMKVTILVDAAGESTAPAEITGTIGTAPYADSVTDSTLTIDLTTQNLRAEDIVHVAIVITGDQP